MPTMRTQEWVKAGFRIYATHRDHPMRTCRAFT